MQCYYDVVFQASSAPDLGLILDGLDKLGLKVIRENPRSLRIAISNQQDDLLDYVLELLGVEIVERVSLPTHMSTDLLKSTSEKKVRFCNFIFRTVCPSLKIKITASWLDLRMKFTLTRVRMSQDIPSGNLF